MNHVTQAQCEYALARIEELLPQVGEYTPASDRKAVELALMSDVVVGNISTLCVNSTNLHLSSFCKIP